MLELKDIKLWRKIGISILAGSLVLSTTLIFWHNLNQEKKTELERNIKLTEAHLKIELKEKIKDQILTLTHMSKQWHFHSPSPEEREAQASLFLENINGYQAIIWIDENNKNRQIISKLNRTVNPKDLNLALLEWDKIAQKQLKDTDYLIVNPLKFSESQEKILLVCIPYFEQEKLQEIIIGVLSVDDFLKHLKLQTVNEDLNFPSTAIRNSNQTFIWTLINPNPTQWIEDISEEIEQKVEELQFDSNQTNFSTPTSTQTPILLGGGITISLLVGISTFLAQTSREKTKKLQKINQALREEITLREAALHQYQKVEQERDRLFLLSPDLLCIAGFDGYFKRINPCFETTLGYPQVELLSKPVIAFVHPEDRAETLAKWEELLTGKSIQLENRYRCQNNSYIWLSWKAAPSLETRLIYAVARNITERKQVEALLRSRVHQQATVAHLGQFALTLSSLDDLFNEALTRMAEVLEVEYTKIVELLPDGEGLLLRAGVGWLEGRVGTTRIQTGNHSQAGYSMLAGEPVVVEDLGKETRFNPSALLQEHDVISGMCVMIRFKDQNFGVLGAHSRTKRVFSQDDVNFLQAIANILATAVEQAQSTERLRLLERAMNSASNGIIITDPTQSDNPIIYANSAVERITGFSRSEIIGRNPRFFQQNNRDQLGINQLREAIGQVEECNVILQNYRSDGTPIWIELYISPVFNEAGVLTHFIGVQNNITERRQAEVALQASEARLRGILEIAQDAIISIDEHHRIQLFNQGAESIFGYSSEELIGKGLEVLIPEFSRGEYRVENLIEPLIRPLEIIGRRQDGREFPAEASVSKLELEEGTFLTIILRDISERKAALRERKQAEMDLRESQHRLSTIITAISDALIVVDVDGIIRFINPAAESLFNRSSGELLDYWFGSLYGKVDRATEVTILHPQGELIVAEMQVSEIIWEGKAATLASLRNVTDRYQAMQQVQQTRNFLQTLIDHLPVAVFVKEGKHKQFGTFTFWNKTSERLFGLKSEQVIGKTVHQLFPPEQAKRMVQQDQEALNWGMMLDIPEEPVHSHSLGRRILHTVKVPLYDEEMEPEYLLCICEDITERQQAEAQLRENEQFLQSIYQGAAVSIFVVDVLDNGEFRYVGLNPAHEQLTQLTNAQLKGKTPAQVLPPSAAENVRQNYLDCVAAQKTISYEEVIQFQDSFSHWLTQLTPICDRQGHIYRIVGTSINITERKLAEEKLRHNAYHDTLTNLPNRAFFMERLQEAIQRVKTQEDCLFAVLFFDLDDFKYINDSLGHAVGDKLLISLTERLKTCLRKSDVLARFGGDEFTILLGEIQQIEQVIKVAQNIQQELSLPFILDSHQVFTNASIGIALVTAEYQQPEEILRDADIAMYSAKEQGQGKSAIFNRQMHLKMLERLQLETDLRRAIEREEFEVYYQPIICLKRDKIAGFEALIRWKHPDGNWVSPAKFIPITEKTGLIVEIGKWVLYQACLQMNSWHKKFPHLGDLTMSVNLSGRQLREPDLLEQIDDIILKTGLKSDCLKLEITESMLMDNPPAVRAILNKIKSRNIKLSLDDFGTGYSSLSYLHSFPIDTLKIDRAFVVATNSELKNKAITQAIVTLAQSLGMEVIAEGIESKDQLEQLKQLKCEYGQGYLFSKPICKTEAEMLLETKSFDV
ncbi:PAS domain S-box protein [Capilliphycus salinus ALCB114379]|uniref:PAS domain S-box protein n=1 Tax=Capilliphycus salinus TaxID=2768948 RepID=UPI0039A474E2